MLSRFSVRPPFRDTRWQLAGLVLTPARFHAVVLVLILTGLILGGIRRSTNSNIGVVAWTLLSLLVFVLAGIPFALSDGAANLRPFFAPTEGTASPAAGFLEACALMFVAYTGYGRIATLAEEVRSPARTIPLAIVVTGLSMMSAPPLRVASCMSPATFMPTVGPTVPAVSALPAR